MQTRWDETAEEVGVCYDLNWNRDSRSILLGRFLDEQGVSFQAWEDFLERAAFDELTGCGGEVGRVDE
jgi:hypothetical protein